jgi:hypothetical protein
MAESEKWGGLIKRIGITAGRSRGTDRPGKAARLA